MSKMIKVKDLEDGMILAESIVNSNGKLLVAAGVELKEKHQKILQIWGINQIKIKTNEEEVSEKIPESYYEYARSELEGKMDWEISNEIEQEAYDIAVEIIAQNKFYSNNKNLEV